MLMMHVALDDEDVLAWDPQDIKNSIEFQRAFDRELQENGETVFNAGLSWPDQARIVRYDQSGGSAITDGPFPQGKQFLIGFWVVDCVSPERAFASAAKASSPPGPTIAFVTGTAARSRDNLAFRFRSPREHHYRET